MMELLSKIRFLPVTIFAATLMLTVKINDIWEGVDGLRSPALSIAGAEAQQRTGEEGMEEPAAEPEMAEPGADDSPLDEDDEDLDLPSVDDKVARSLTVQDPTLLTQAEIDLLQQLAERREALDQRQRELDLRTGMLDAAEARIEKKIDELKRFQATIEDLIKTYDTQQEAKLKSLVKVYENMKPKEAARIFQELDMDTLLTVAAEMKERKLAAVLAKMDGQKASEVTYELMRLRDLPTPAPEGG